MKAFDERVRDVVELLSADLDKQMALAREIIVKSLVDLGHVETAEEVRRMSDDELEAFSSEMWDVLKAADGTGTETP